MGRTAVTVGKRRAISGRLRLWFTEIRPMLRGRQINQSAVAKRLGAPRPTVADWLAGNSAPEVEHLIRIAAREGLSLDWLLLGAGKPEQAPRPEVKAASLSHASLAEELRRRVAADLTSDYSGELAKMVEEEVPSGDDLLRDLIARERDAARVRLEARRQAVALDTLRAHLDGATTKSSRGELLNRLGAVRQLLERIRPQPGQLELSALAWRRLALDGVQTVNVEELPPGLERDAAEAVLRAAEADDPSNPR